MDTGQLVRYIARPLGGISLAELEALRAQLIAGRAEQEQRLARLEARTDTLFTDGAARADLRGQRARAGQIATLDAEANQIAALLRVAHKQILLLDRLIWLRESLAAIERLRQETPAAVPIDWPALVDATAPLGDDEARLDQLNDALGMAEGRWQIADGGLPMADGGAQVADGRLPMADGGAQMTDGRPQVANGAVRRTNAGQPAGPLVVRVFDGATIELATGQRVRYIGVDAPQMRNALGKADAGAWEARDANRALVGHKRVRLEADQLDADIDGALWRYVYVGNILVNAELLRQGAAYHASRYPNNRHAETLLAAEQDARRHKRGLWREPN